jgi:hypothetical protein
MDAALRSPEDADAALRSPEDENAGTLFGTLVLMAPTYAGFIKPTQESGKILRRLNFRKFQKKSAKM